MLKIFAKIKKSFSSLGESIDIFQLYLSLLILGAFYLLNEQYEYIRSVNLAINHSFAKIDSLERKESLIYDITKSLLSEDSSKEQILEKICTAITDNSIDLPEIAEAYNCLAKIEYNKKDTFSAYNAIKNISYALEANYKEEYLKNLQYFITDNITSTKTIEELTNSNNKDIKNKALYRMSLIYLLGRSSSIEKIDYQIEKSIHIKSKLLKELDTSRNQKVNILLSLNNDLKYLNYAKIVISSILLNADLNTYYNFYILMDKDDPISQNNKNNLQSLTYIAPYNIEFKYLHTEMLKNYKGFSSVKNRLLFGRFMVEDIFPELDSIITLDVDIIALRDLYKLQNQEGMDQYVFAAMSEGFDIIDKSSCNLPYTYVNAGVTVQNLKKMREIKSTNLIIDKYEEMQNTSDSECLFHLEQDVLNILFKDKIKFFSKKWNYIPIQNYDNRFMPFIIHFAGIRGNRYNNLPYPQIKLLNNQYSQIKFMPENIENKATSE